MFETLMATIKSKVVSAEFRSATAARMQAMFNMMAQARTNAGEFYGDAADEGGERPRPAQRAPGAREKTIGEVFASMMSNPRAAAPAAMAVPVQASAPRPAAAVGRNDPCPCGSGKKYKKCCGRNLA